MTGNRLEMGYGVCVPGAERRYRRGDAMDIRWDMAIFPAFIVARPLQGSAGLAYRELDLRAGQGRGICNS